MAVARRVERGRCGGEKYIGRWGGWYGGGGCRGSNKGVGSNCSTLEAGVVAKRWQELWPLFFVDRGHVAAARWAGLG